MLTKEYLFYAKTSGGLELVTKGQILTVMEKTYFSSSWRVSGVHGKKSLLKLKEKLIRFKAMFNTEQNGTIPIIQTKTGFMQKIHLDRFTI